MEQSRMKPRMGGRMPEDEQWENSDFEEDEGGDAEKNEVVESFREGVIAVMQMQKEGRLPEDFDLAEASRDRAFGELILEYPPEAAVRIYVAEKRLAGAESGAKKNVQNDLRARHALPKSQRANITANPSPDYKRMSSEEFRRLEQQYKRAARNGNKVNF